MALSETDVSEITTRYAGGQGESITALAKAFGVTRGAIRYHVKKDDMTEPSNEASDEALGIGEEDGVDALAAMMANPALQALIAKAVDARIAQMGATAAATPAQPGGDAFNGLAEALRLMIENQQMQQPGYTKPLPLEEVKRRTAGKVEMDALLRTYQDANTPPLYAVGEGGFFECTNAIELNEGQQLRTYLSPPESFTPLNEEARNVHAAMMQWIGGPSPEIGERLKQAQLDAKAQAPLIGSEPVAVLDPRQRGGLIEIVDGPVAAPERASSKRRSMGTVVTEPVDISLTARTPLAAANTASGAPAGPNFASV